MVPIPKNERFDVFREAKQYPLEAILARYDIDVGYNGVFLCPFHNDHRPSAGIYEDKNGQQRWNCFACEANGTGIDFVMGMNGCDALTAAKTIYGWAGKACADKPRTASARPSSGAPRKPIIRPSIKLPKSGDSGGTNGTNS